VPRKLVLTEIARNDLSEIYDFIATDSPKNAASFISDLTKQIAWIAESDFPGAPRDHVAAGLRAFVYRRRCIYFRLEADTVLILRVVHGARDVDALTFPTETT